MRMKRLFAVLGALLVVALIQGCAKYKVTQPLSEPLPRGTVKCVIGDITESLPTAMDPENKPPLEDIEKFQVYLKEELDNKNVFQQVLLREGESEYEVTGNILDYKRGSGAARFFIGFGVGNAKLTIEMKLIDTATDEILFAGNFKRSISGGLETGMKMYRQVAQDFAKELDKQLKKLEKG